MWKIRYAFQIKKHKHGKFTQERNKSLYVYKSRTHLALATSAYRRLVQNIGGIAEGIRPTDSILSKTGSD